MQNQCIQISPTLVKILKGFNINNPQFRFTSLGVKDLVKTGTLRGFNINNLTLHSAHFRAAVFYR